MRSIYVSQDVPQTTQSSPAQNFLQSYHLLIQATLQLLIRASNENKAGMYNIFTSGTEHRNKIQAAFDEQLNVAKDIMINYRICEKTEDQGLGEFIVALQSACASFGYTENYTLTISDLADACEEACLENKWNDFNEVSSQLSTLDYGIQGV